MRTVRRNVAPEVIRGARLDTTGFAKFDNLSHGAAYDARRERNRLHKNKTTPASETNPVVEGSGTVLN